MSTKKYTLIEGAYLEDILRQPRALHDTFESLAVSEPLRTLARELKDQCFRRIILTGMGSSLYALYPLSLRLNSRGQTALLVETSELVHYLEPLIAPESLLVAVSQSGQSAEMIRLIEKNDGRAKIVAITNTADSPLSQHAYATLLTHAGPEYSASAKTYVTALMAIEFAGSILDGNGSDAILLDLAEAEGRAADYLAAWRDHVIALADLLGGIKRLFLVGRGRSLAAAKTGALILKESAKFHAEGMSSAAFRHGPMEMVNDETLVAIFEGEDATRDLNHKLLSDIKSQGGRAELIGQNSTHPALRLFSVTETIRPILEILPVQMMTLALNARTGTEAGRFDFATKITRVE